MSTRKVEFAVGEFYHVYNRGIDKRSIFDDREDLERFRQSMEEFNTLDSIGSIYEHSFSCEGLGGEASKLVAFSAYCLNPNHFHFLLRQEEERGIEKFMQRLGTGYTMYFNNKYRRSGSLFQGVFKAVHVASNEYFLHVHAYVNLNDRVHQLGGEASKLSWSSWPEYAEGKPTGFSGDFVCETDAMLEDFGNREDYKRYAEESLAVSLEKKAEKRELESLMLD